MTFSSATWNVSNIITEFRGITGVPDTTMLPDAQVLNLLNFYYQNVLPKELKIFFGYTYYQFFTYPNVDQYIAPVNFQTLNPDVRIDGFPLEWYLSPDTFFQDYRPFENKLVIGSGDGLTATFPFNLGAYPILQRSLYVTDSTYPTPQIIQDTLGTGVLGGSGGTGTINYLSGTGSVTFNNNPPAGNVTASFENYITARPQGILFYKTMPLADSTQATLNAVNMFVLRPVPGEVHLVKMQGIQVPPALTLNPGPSAPIYTDVPFRPDLGPLIALGAALHRFKLFNQMDQYEQYLPEYNRFKDICMQDTYEEYIYQRSVPTF